MNTTKNSMRRYCILLGSGLLVFLCAGAAFNVVLDPYRIFQWLPEQVGLNQIKPRPSRSPATLKWLQAVQANPDVLILGNSRAEMGFDPLHPSWQGQRVFNLAVPGVTIQSNVQHWLSLQASGIHPKRLLIGVDFLDFLGDTPLMSVTDSASPPSPLAFTKTLWQQRLQALFSEQGLRDSWQTLRMQHHADAPQLTAQGFNPMLDYATLVQREGYASLFAQRIQESASTLQKTPKRMPTDAPSWRALQALLTDCAQRGVQVDVLIYPYHQQMQQLWQAQGVQPFFQQWRQELQTLVQTTNAMSPNRLTQPNTGAAGKPIRLWDFSEWTEVVTLPVPTQKNTLVQPTAAQWYWEAGHFKRELGDRILQQINLTQ